MSPRSHFLEIDGLESRCLPAVIVVNSLADILSPPPGVVTLRSAVQMVDNAAAGGFVGDTIELNIPGTYRLTTLNDGATDNSRGELAIFGSQGYDLSIINTSGGGVVIDGGGLHRVFDINPAALAMPQSDVSFADLTITDGYANGNGGGILAQHGVSVFLKNVDLTGNGASGDGGGVSVSVGTLSIKNGSIAHNTAQGDGGGVYSTSTYNTLLGNVSISHAFFQGNNATGNGGALSVDGADTSVTGTSFVGNVAANGGAINAGANSLSLQYCTLDQNQAIGNISSGFGGVGGGITVSQPSFGHSSVAITVANCLFLDNAANFEDKGGGGAIDQESDLGSLTIVNSRFSGNRTTGAGGSILFDGMMLTMSGTTIDNSRSGGGGGGLAFRGTITGQVSTLTDDTLTLNSASLLGGGILDEGSGTLNLVHDTINANYGDAGGGGVALISQGVLAIEDTIIAQNGASKGIPGVDALNDNDTQMTDNGGNLIGDATGANGFNPGPLIGTTAHIIDANLGLLLDNGSRAPYTPVTIGGTSVMYYAGTPGSLQAIPTEAVSTTSPAFNAGITASVATTDQRGFPIPTRNPSIGAYQAQYASTATPSQIYVEDLYEVLLNRVADPRGLAFWSSLVDSSGSNAGLVGRFEGSQEFRVDQLSLFYESYLNRQADAGGQAAWLVFLNSGNPLTQVQAMFLGSVEYFADHGNAYVSVVESIYENLLDRLPQSQEVEGEVQMLQAGVALPTVAADFVNSQESITDLILADYSAILGRPASDNEVTLWLDFVTGSTFPKSLINAGILGSTEAFEARTGSAG